MSAVELLQPILDGGLARNNFFNGRLLSAEDLRAEQVANRLQHAHLARAIGDGVGWGLTVASTSGSSTGPRVTVTRGVAINRAGDILHLPEDSEVTLVPEPKAVADEAGLFGACKESGTPLASTQLAEGAYVLVVSPISGYRDTAIVSDPNSTAIGRGACGARFTVEGVTFRLVSLAMADLGAIADRITGPPALLPPGMEAVGRERLRNLLAHACFGTRDLEDYLDDQSEPVGDATQPAGWGAIDAMRFAGRLTDCDVTLAVVVLTGTKISFVDMWSARRRPIDAGAIEAWRAVAGPRRVAEGEAAFLQFQAHLEIVRGLEATSAAATIAAGKYFDYLPAGGWLPTGAGGFDWRVFLGPHAPPQAKPVERGLLRGIIERSWLDEPFAFDAEPRVAVDVFRAIDEDFVVFARSHTGSIRLALTPAPAAGQAVEVEAQAVIGPAVRSATLANGKLVLVELLPGVQRLTVTAPDYEAVDEFDVRAVGGRIVELPLGLTPLPDQKIIVSPINKTTRVAIVGVSSISAIAGTTTYTGLRAAGTAWIIPNLPAGSYTLEGIATGFKPASLTGVPARPPGDNTSVVLEFEPLPQAPSKPDDCIRVDDVTRPSLGDILLCMRLEAAEFEEEFFYGTDRPEVGPRAKSGRRYAIGSRSSARHAEKGQRYVAPSGHIVYTVPVWSHFVEIEPRPLSLRAWLSDWRLWFADEFDSDEIRESKPTVFIAENYLFPKTWAEIPIGPPAYAVFGKFAVPLTIRPVDGMTHLPVPIEEVSLIGMPIWLIRLLEELGIRYIDELAWLWAEFIGDLTGGPIDPIQHLIHDAFTEVVKINEGFGYIPGMTPEVLQALDEAEIFTDVQLANADLGVLAGKIGLGAAVRLQDLARQIVPAESYSLEGLGLTQPQIETLHAQGIDSKGTLIQKAETESGKIADALGLGGLPDADRKSAVGALVNDATKFVMRHSIAAAPEMHLGLWPGIDSQTAMRVGRAGITSVAQLGMATPESVAAVAGITLDAATRLVTEAKATSRSGKGLDAVAGLTAAERDAIAGLPGGGNLTLGGLALKTPGELAVAFGDDAARASAFLDGLAAGLAAGRR